jgi:histidine ammonia-lyase
MEADPVKLERMQKIQASVMNRETNSFEFDGSDLGLSDLMVLASGPWAASISPKAMDKARRSWELAGACADRRPVYGRTTGVGANRSVTLANRTEQDRRLLRSHASGMGEYLPTRTVRATMIVRLNQLLNGGSGIHPDVIVAMAGALADGNVPQVHAHGAIGTADLSALAEIALALMGEVPFENGQVRKYWVPVTGDALPFIESNALTVAQGCLGLAEGEIWLDHYLLVSCLSLVAVHGSTEPFAHAVHAARPQPGQAQVAQQVRENLAGYTPAGTRVQDSYGFRALPQVAGAMRASLDSQAAVLGIEANAAPENPLFSVEDGDVFHNANFHALPLALAMDHTKLALSSAAHLSGARLNNLSDPGMTGLNPFLSDDEPGSSGVMLLEYNSAAALARLRNAAQPASLGLTVISRGTEDHASFAAQGADQLRDALRAATDVVACELLSAVRALSINGTVPDPATRLGRYFLQAQSRFNADVTDRPLGEDLSQAVSMLQNPFEN